MPLRIGFDMDGVLADFAQAFHAVESRLYGPGPELSPGQPEREEAEQAAAADREAGDEEPPSPGPEAGPKSSSVEDFHTARKAARELRRRRDAIWNEIQKTPDFWMALKPIEEDAVR